MGLRHKATGILEQQNQLPFNLWRGFKPKTAIERVGTGIDGVRQQRPNARLFGNGKGAADGVLQQAEAKALPLVIEVNGKPRQDDQRNWILPHAATNPLGRIKRVDLANGQTVVPSNPLTITHDKGSCRAAALGLARVAV